MKPCTIFLRLYQVLTLLLQLSCPLSDLSATFHVFFDSQRSQPPLRAAIGCVPTAQQPSKLLRRRRTVPSAICQTTRTPYTPASRYQMMILTLSYNTIPRTHSRPERREQRRSPSTFQCPEKNPRSPANTHSLHFANRSTALKRRRRAAPPSNSRSGSQIPARCACDPRRAAPRATPSPRRTRCADGGPQLSRPARAPSGLRSGPCGLSGGGVAAAAGPPSSESESGSGRQEASPG